MVLLFAWVMCCRLLSSWRSSSCPPDRIKLTTLGRLRAHSLGLFGKSAFMAEARARQRNLIRRSRSWCSRHRRASARRCFRSLRRPRRRQHRSTTPWRWCSPNSRAGLAFSDPASKWPRLRRNRTSAQARRGARRSGRWRRRARISWVGMAGSGFACRRWRDAGAAAAVDARRRRHGAYRAGVHPVFATRVLAKGADAVMSPLRRALEPQEQLRRRRKPGRDR